MNTSKALLSLAALVLGLLLIAGCSNAGEDEMDGLHEALSMTPNRADLDLFIFTNWQNSQPDNPQTIINSNSSLGDDWSWGIDDIEWEFEMNFAEGAAPVRIFKFNKEFDIATVSAVYGERGFKLAEYGDGFLYSHEPVMSGNPPIISHANTLILPKNRIMVITSGGGITNLQSLFEFYTEPGGKESQADLPVMTGLMQELENEQQISVIWHTCDTLTANDMVEFYEQITGTQSSDEEMAALRDILSNVHSYNTLGIGFHYEDTLTVGKIVFGYDSAEKAASDLQIRESLADLSTFSLDNIRAEGSNLILDVTNTNPEPTPLDWVPANFFSPNSILFLCP